MKSYAIGIGVGLLQLILIPNHFILAVTVLPLLAVVVLAFSTGFVAVKWGKLNAA